jgi:hypothetical protein
VEHRGHVFRRPAVSRCSSVGRLRKVVVLLLGMRASRCCANCKANARLMIWAGRGVSRWVSPSWLPPDVTPLKGRGAHSRAAREEPLRKRAMQDHGATVGPQCAVARVKNPGRGGWKASRVQTARFGSSARRDAVPWSHQPVPAPICSQERIGWWRVDGEREQRRVRVGSHVGRDSVWLAGPGLQLQPAGG